MKQRLLANRDSPVATMLGPYTASAEKQKHKKMDVLVNIRIFVRRDAHDNIFLSDLIADQEMVVDGVVGRRSLEKTSSGRKPANRHRV